MTSRADLTEPIAERSDGLNLPMMTTPPAVTETINPNMSDTRATVTLLLSCCCNTHTSTLDFLCNNYF